MKVPLFILGFLMRQGSLHGYRIKQLITERASDFAQIKLPTIYYHLEQLQKNGYVTSRKEKEGKRPDRFVYEITSQGRKQFENLLTESLDTLYTAEFDLDAALFFRDELDDDALNTALKSHENYLRNAVKEIKRRREEILTNIPDEAKLAVRAIFSHHLVHYNAELRWVRAVLLDLTDPGRYID